jgi:hypothetical protein
MLGTAYKGEESVPHDVEKELIKTIDVTCTIQDIELTLWQTLCVLS